MSTAEAKRGSASETRSETQLRPVYYYEALAHRDSTIELLCDPLTKLVSYQSFESYVIANFYSGAHCGFHLAVGDVDDLRGYVTSQKAIDDSMFGHVAGNHCMKRIGEIVTEWRETHSIHWPELICATFGGDEVIIAATGASYELFCDHIDELAIAIGQGAPRPCSFVCATDVLRERSDLPAAIRYRTLVSTVDQQLFQHKERARAAGDDRSGAVLKLVMSPTAVKSHSES